MAASLALAVGLAPAAEAAVVYEYKTQTGSFPSFDFRYTAPDFITVDTEVLGADLDACTPHNGAACYKVIFDVSMVENALASSVRAFTGPSSGTYVFLPLNIFSTPGSYVRSRFSLTVDVVPEPSTWALMIAGFGLAGAALRRRRGVALAA